MDHPDLDTLAELEAGLPPDEEAADLRTHVAGCATCQAAAAALSDTRAALHSLPPAPLPSHVADRLDAALAEVTARTTRDEPAATKTVVPIRQRRRLHMGSGLAGAAAAAAVVLLLVGIVAGALRASHQAENHRAGAKTTSLTKAPQRYVETSSGRDYTQSTLPAAAVGLLGQSAGKQTLDSSSGGATLPGGTSPSPAFGAAAPAAPELARLKAEPLALFDCISALTGRAAPVTVPLAVDFARFNGKPAVVIVLPTPGNPAKADVWVVGPGCSAKDDQTRYFVRITR